ncbi:unnamed protein product [marine sediment metagenome]|uniref:Uncharacterized protein n=1 Tax=marine sediment metagenome TaxID=412755 RepID=X1NJM5_9ZZZZ
MSSIFTLNHTRQNKGYFYAKLVYRPGKSIARRTVKFTVMQQLLLN